MTVCNARGWPAVWRPPLEILLLLMGGLVLYEQSFGLSSLDPRNTAWMLQGDPAQHYLGWQFFRNEPWQWPPGRISTFGLPLGTSIVFTDSIPLLALLLKPVSAHLPGEFQYFGLWMLACYILNGLVAWKLLCQFTQRVSLRLLASLFFMLSPPLLMRGYGHEALMAHALLLLGFLGYIRNWKGSAWGFLLAIAALTHAYLLLMLLGIWAASLARRLQCSRSWPSHLKEALGIIALLAPLMYLAGYFVPGTGAAAEGYGFFSMNMLALVQPNFLEPRFGYSPIWSGPPVATGGQYEGYLYLGAGMLILSLAALVTKLPGWIFPLSRWIEPPGAPEVGQPPSLGWLLLVCLLFWCLALSSQVTLGAHTLITLDLPHTLHKLLSIFRASGRLGWPIYYLLMLIILIAVLQRYKPAAALALLLSALIIQYIELQPKHRALHQSIEQRHRASTPLASPDWQSWGARARKLLIFAPENQIESIYIPFATLAAQHRLATNASHTARAQAGDRQAYLQAEWNKLEQGAPDPTTIHVFPDADKLRALPAALRQQIQTRDGYHILAPGG